MKLNVVTTEEDGPIDREVLASSIRRIADAAKALQRQGMNRHAIVVLLVHSTKLPHKTVKMVLESIADLEHDYCEARVRGRTK